MDRTNWTPELKRLLNFDQSQALQVDNGEVATETTFALLRGYSRVT